jgi:hypothetical protein
MVKLQPRRATGACAVRTTAVRGGEHAHADWYPACGGDCQVFDILALGPPRPPAMPAFNASIFASQLKVRASAPLGARGFVLRPCLHGMRARAPARWQCTASTAAVLPTRTRGSLGARGRARPLPALAAVPGGCCGRARVLTCWRLPAAPWWAGRSGNAHPSLRTHSGALLSSQSTENAVDTVVKAATKVGTNGGSIAVKVRFPPSPLPCPALCLPALRAGPSEAVVCARPGDVVKTAIA